MKPIVIASAVLTLGMMTATASAQSTPSVSAQSTSAPRTPERIDDNGDGAAPHVEEARTHFEAAHRAYGEGHYRNAIRSLEQALALDPNGTDLLYDLALVHEKLGELATSAHYVRRYIALENDPAERRRAEQWLYRLQGAQAEFSAPKVVHAHVPRAEAGRRLSPWVLATGAVAVVGAASAGFWGIRAVTTQADGEASDSQAERRDRADAVRSQALVADVSLGISLAAASVAVLLCWLELDRPAAAQNTTWQAKPIRSMLAF